MSYGDFPKPVYTGSILRNEVNMRIKFRPLTMVLAISIAACNIGVEAPTEPAPTAVEVLPTSAPTATEVQPTPIEHTSIPGEFPEQPSGAVGDQDSSVTAEDHRAPGGDRFTFTRFERPFNSQTMDEYYPYIDIQEGFIFEDAAWIYASLKLKSDEASRELKGRYAVEIDFNLDGGGDWLILVSNPVSTEWTTDAVQAWFDTNDDVGGEIPTTTDGSPVAEDGYETLEFDAGVGNDPDLAWARVSPDDPNTVHFAMKKDILQGNKSFLAGFWAGNEDLDPGLFEYSDNFTHDQAGASLTELEYFYPIKELSALDNTCRMAVGFQPTGNEPGICPLPPRPAGDEPEPLGCTGEIVCYNFGNQQVCYCVEP